MDDYDAPSMRFGLENDYENGEFGEDGEFYAAGVRKGKTQSKEKAMYGIFGDSSDEEDGRRRGKFAGKPKGKVDYSGGVNFVSGGLKGQESFKDSDEEGKRSGDDDAEESEEEMPRFGAGRKRGRHGGGSDGSDDERVAQRDPEADLPMSFGAKKEEKPAKRRVEQSKEERESMGRLAGISNMGLKMLQKMGYKGGGLGKDGSGITKAIEAKKRVAGEGLGNRPEHKQELKPEDTDEGTEGKVCPPPAPPPRSSHLSRAPHSALHSLPTECQRATALSSRDASLQALLRRALRAATRR
jgi:tuftelin-interacting protein 11